MTRTSRHLALAAILTVAAATRLLDLGNTPPGIHHDEASNGYDAYSILKTGQDRWGESRPVLLEAFGREDYRAALYAYLIIPFHALLGPEQLILATRLPAALIGLLTIASLYALVARTHNAAAALWAALFLTLSPWHLQLSRFGHESSLTPAFTIFALTLMAYARWPFQRDNDHTKLRTLPLAIAGALFALSLYSYPSMRVFTPAFLVAAAVIYRRPILNSVRPGRNRTAVTTALAMACVFATPIVMLTITSWEKTMARAQQVSLFHQKGLVEALIQTASQYAAHFSPEWLFIDGDSYPVQSPPGLGQLNLVLAPFLIAGIFTAARYCRQNRTNTLLLAWLLLYPIAAAPTDAAPHALRSACGLPVFQWLAAIGCHAILSSIASSSRRAAIATICTLAVTANGAFAIRDYFFGWARDPWVAALYQKDLCDAMRVVRPIRHNYDRIYVSNQYSAERRWYSGEAYIIVLLALPIEPEDFHAWSKSIIYERPTDGFHRVESFGPFIMTTRTDVLERSFKARPHQRSLFIARPGEQHGRLIDTVTDENGTPRFEIIDLCPHPHAQ
ncbi:MAG: glycosyltransferase family 39 protein [Phycisphaerae bacterium]